MTKLPKKHELKLKLTPNSGVEKAAKLPLLVSVPHGGYSVPFDVLPDILLDHHDIFPDSDPYTRQIYGFEEEVYSYIDTEVARAVIDLNRSETDLPPKNPDGVIKSHTIMDALVYREGFQPDSKKRAELLSRYYHPYHQRIHQEMNDPNLLCGIDCHTMLEYPPGKRPDPALRRPFICLSNNGDSAGEGSDEQLTCSPEMILLLADCLQEEFPEEAESILLNTPFKGGYISRAHSNKLPWIQIELNRCAYLSPPWFDQDTLQVCRYRLAYLRFKFLRALANFCEEALLNFPYRPPTRETLRNEERVLRFD